VIDYQGYLLSNQKGKPATSVVQLIGNTPLVRLERLSPQNHILAKLEMFNPSSSVKDRLALAMIAEAEQKGLKAGGGVVTASSGNAGIGLAMVCAVRGYHCTVTMPQGMSSERVSLMQAYGAEVILTEADQGMVGSINKASQIAVQKGFFLLNQFSSQENAQIHYLTTGPEIWADCDQKVDMLVCTIGSGGTISGCARFLKEKNPEICIVGVEPLSSAVLSGGKAGSHLIQGIGAGFVPEILQRQLLDRVETVSDEEALECTRWLASREGLLCGISSGAATAVALRLAHQKKYRGKCIVVILPDSGQRYLSGGVF